MRAKVIFMYVGISLVLVAIMMALSGLVAVFSGPDDSTMPLLFSAFITFIMGIYPMIFVRPEPNISFREGVATVVLAWLACCVFGTIPYLCYGGEFTFVDAFFESVSGFTTTGASILNDIEALPAGLLFWRASTAWVGGLGIVSIFSLVIPQSLDRMSILSGAELSDIAKSQSSRHGKSFILTMLTVYITLTVTCALCLKIAGLPWFDAVTDALSTCSTCGFCIRNNSIGSYGNMGVEAIIMVFMLISGISFMQTSSYVLRKGNARRRISTVTRAYLGFVLVATLIITINLRLHQDITVLHALRLAAFQVCSITTTTGFATADTSVWPALSVVLLILASVVCGCSGSTSGGMKMDRVVLLLSYIRQSFRRGNSQRRLARTRLDGRIVPEDLADKTIRFVLLYVAFLVAGALINTMAGLDIPTAMTASVACLGNVGPGFGNVGSMSNYADFPVLLKLSSTILMIAGRLEIIPILTFLGLMRR